MSREALAALAGLSPRTIYAIERERVRPQRATIHVLAVALGCEPADLFPEDARPAGNRARVTTTAGGAVGDAGPG